MGMQPTVTRDTGKFSKMTMYFAQKKKKKRLKEMRHYIPAWLEGSKKVVKELI